MDSLIKNILTHRFKPAGDLLNILYIVYAFLLPFSGAFVYHTAPFIILLLWVIEGNLKEKLKIILSNKAIILYVLFILFSSLSIMWSNDYSLSFNRLKNYTIPLIVMLTMFTSLNMKYLKFIILSFLFSLFVLEMISYGIYFDLFDYSNYRHASPSNPSTMNHIFYSIFIAVGIIFTLYAMMNSFKENKYLFIGELILFSTLLINLFIGRGKTGQFALLIALITIVVIKNKYKIKQYILFFAASISLLVVFYSFSNNFKETIDRFDYEIRHLSSDKNSSTSFRIGMKLAGLEAVKTSPIYGFGIGSYNTELSKIISESDKYHYLRASAHPHDQYLRIILESGIVGLFLFISFFVYSLIYSYNTGSFRIKLLSYGVVSIFLFSFLTDIPLHDVRISALFGFTMGIIHTLIRNNGQELNEQII